MVNLLKDTEEVLKENDKTWEDVEWIGSIDSKGDWVEIPAEKFKGLADIECSDRYGAPEIEESLVVVGEDWWLERIGWEEGEPEGWCFRKIPKSSGRKCIRNNLYSNHWN